MSIDSHHPPLPFWYKWLQLLHFYFEAYPTYLRQMHKHMWTNKTRRTTLTNHLWVERKAFCNHLNQVSPPFADHMVYIVHASEPQMLNVNDNSFSFQDDFVTCTLARWYYELSTKRRKSSRLMRPSVSIVHCCTNCTKYTFSSVSLHVTS